MRDLNPFSAYQQSSVQGATPVALVVSLYDTILRDFRRALDAIDSGKVETRVAELNHALTVIAHLRGVLNFEKGGEAAKRFENFYEVTRGLVLQVNAENARENLMKLMELYSSVRQAWQVAEQQVASGSAGIPQAPAQAAERPATAAKSTAKAAAQEAAEPASRATWSA